MLVSLHEKWKEINLGSGWIYFMIWSKKCWTDFSCILDDVVLWEGYSRTHLVHWSSCSNNIPALLWASCSISNVKTCVLCTARQKKNSRGGSVEASGPKRSWMSHVIVPDGSNLHEREETSTNCSEPMGGCKILWVSSYLLLTGFWL